MTMAPDTDPCVQCGWPLDSVNHRLMPPAPGFHGYIRPDVHDPSGRECALAGRKAAGHAVDTYCRPCYRDILAGPYRALLAAR
jgi:hypothetical protein